ncbi:MAG: Asp23/Gls24 family envelope stress response protein [Anaerolineales bacterium]|nr:MAG: Asp23/Gls24 family envelope stress response protein [Anaerolineales bacterium]
MSSKKKEGGRAPGTTTMAPGVLVTLAKLTALSVPGVVGMAPLPGGVNRLFRRGVAEGVRIEIEEGSVCVDLYLILQQDTNVRNISRKVQAEVARAIEEMVGMTVASVDVHIEDIDYSSTDE